MNYTTKFIFNLLKENKKEILKISLIALVSSALSITIPLIYGKLFDAATIPNTPTTFLFSLIIIWLITSLISNYTSNKERYLGEIFGARVSWLEEAKAYGHFLTLPIAFHKNKKTGEILNKLSRGSWEIERLITNISKIFPNMIILVGTSFIIIFIQWQLSLVLFFSLLIYVFVTIKFSKEITDSSERVNKFTSKQYGKIYDKLYNPLFVKNFAMEEAERKGIIYEIEKILEVMKDYSKSSKKIFGYQSTIYSISFIIVLSCAIFFLRNGSITSGQFIMFFGYTHLVFSPLYMLTDV
jgi:ABC-type multidrug transport system fused ATPase/permease subunit